jgi:hypothetical protein
MRLEKLPDNHYGIDGEPVYKLVAKHREWMGESKSQFARRNGLDHASQYRFEAGKNHSLSFAIKQLEIIGYEVTITVTLPKPVKFIG